MSWNVRGLCRSMKKLAVKNALEGLKPEMIFLQETKLDANRNKEFHSWAHAMGVMIYEEVTVPALGTLGGLVVLWRRNAMLITREFKDQRYIFLTIQFRVSSICCTVGNIYRLYDVSARASFFNSLREVIHEVQGCRFVCRRLALGAGRAL